MTVYILAVSFMLHSEQPFVCHGMGHQNWFVPFLFAYRIINKYQYTRGTFDEVCAEQSKITVQMLTESSMPHLYEANILVPVIT